MRAPVLAALLSVAVTTLPAPMRAQEAHLFVLPYLGSAPETGIQVGATAFRVVQPRDTATRPSTAQVFASYTAKRQLRAFLEADRWTAGNDWRIVGHLEWARTPLLFYGVGDRTPDEAEEIYTPRGVIASALVQRRVRGPLYAIAGYRYQDMRIGGLDSAGALRDGTVRGARGGRVVQWQGGALWDDRDDVFAPRRGTFVQGTASLADGGDFRFTRLVLDARRFVPVGAARTVALQVASEMTDGDAPFDQLSLVGSSSYLRGYARGRFRDRHLVAAQAEYRAPLWRRFGWAAFAGAGRIAGRTADLFDSEARTLPTYGIGVRRTLFAGSRSAIRVDYARGISGQSGLYVALNEAF